jgi:hypothetical protein
MRGEMKRDAIQLKEEEEQLVRGSINRTVQATDRQHLADVAWRVVP